MLLKFNLEVGRQIPVIVCNTSGWTVLRKPRPLTRKNIWPFRLCEPWRDGWLRSWELLSELSLRVTNPAYCQPDAPLSRFILRPRAACLESDEERGERSQHAQVRLCGSLWKICHMSLWLKSDKQPKRWKICFWDTCKRETYSISKLYIVYSSQNITM